MVRTDLQQWGYRAQTAGTHTLLPSAFCQILLINRSPLIAFICPLRCSFASDEHLGHRRAPSYTALHALQRVVAALGYVRSSRRGTAYNTAPNIERTHPTWAASI